MLIKLCLMLISANSVLGIFKTEDGEETHDAKYKQNEEIIGRFVRDLPKNMQSCIEFCMNGCSTESKKRDIGLNCMAPCIDRCSTGFVASDSEDSSEESIISALKDLPKSFCSNRNDREKMTAKEYLLEFAKGPCSPLIIVPGVTATKLVISISCEDLQANEKEVFDHCGWNACSKRSFEFWKSVPDPEYYLWIPDILSPMSIMSVSDKSNLCFANLIIPNYDLSKPISEMFEPRKGVRITVSGFTDKTKKGSLCGWSAISDLLPIKIQTSKSKGFSKLLTALQYAGYVSGLTMQSMPYNFYYSYRNNEYLKNFQSNLDRLNKLTGKKATLIAHSMGNLNVLHNLKQMSQDDKKSKIFNWVSIAAPFLGSPISQKTLVSGTDKFITLGGYFGFHVKAFILTASNQMSLYEIAAVDPFKIYEGQKWFENLKTRMEYEKEGSKTPYEQSGIPFWPPKDDVCHDQRLDSKKKGCTMNIYNTTEKSMLKIGEEEYFISDTESLIGKYNHTNTSSVLFDKLYDENFAMANPEVPVFLIFESSIQTPVHFQFNDSLKAEIDAGVYPTPLFVDYADGDGTVPLYSTIIPALKWALEHDSPVNATVNYQPVKFIEYCGLGHKHSSIYDKNSLDKPFEIIKNDYVGLPCECNSSSTSSYGKTCNHACIHGDSNVINLILEIAISNQIASAESQAYIQTLDNQELEDGVEKCSHFHPSIFN
jgi:hypothetical protein